MNFRHRQNGAVLILVVVGIVAMLGIIGLALDGAHAMLNKTRLQNSVDAAALSGAKELNIAGDEVQARAAVILAFAANGAAPGNNEIGDAYADGTIDLQIQFSKTLNPFVPGTIPAEYIRVRALNFEMPIWGSVILLVVGAIMVPAGIFEGRKRKTETHYLVLLTMSSGDATAFNLEDEAEVDRAVAAIGEAMARQG